MSAAHIVSWHHGPLAVVPHGSDDISNLMAEQQCQLLCLHHGRLGLPLQQSEKEGSNHCARYYHLRNGFTLVIVILFIL